MMALMFDFRGIRNVFDDCDILGVHDCPDDLNSCKDRAAFSVMFMMDLMTVVSVMYMMPSIAMCIDVRFGR